MAPLDNGKEGSKFRPLTAVPPRERIMKEAIRIVVESIYDPEFPDTAHFRAGRGCQSVLRQIKEEWESSRWFLEFDIQKHTVDRKRLISILKEEIDDPKFLDDNLKVGRRRAEKGPTYVTDSVLLSALTGNIYLQDRKSVV